MEKPTPLTRAAFPHFHDITTRWMDNDVYGHVNNVVYYSFFDTVINRYLLDHGALDIQRSTVIGLAVESQCSYFKPIAYPDLIRAGLRVGRLGHSSVRYEVGIFRNDDDEAAAQGYFVHVYVERASSRPVALPEALKQALKPLVR